MKLVKIYFIVINLLVLQFSHISCVQYNRDNPFDPNGTNWNPPIVIAQNDTSVNINDSIKLCAQSIGNKKVSSFIWYYPFQKIFDTTVSGETVTAFSKDTSHLVLVMGKDFEGVTSATDSIEVLVTLDPPIIIAQNDTTINIRDTITLSVSAIDNAPVNLFVWAINGINFKDSTQTGKLNTFFLDSGVANVKVKAIDNDHIESAIDSIKITVTLGTPIVSLRCLDSINIYDSCVIRAITSDNGNIEKYFWALDGENYTLQTLEDSIITAFSKVGETTIKVKVLDDDSIHAIDSASITVTLDPPTIDSLRDTVFSINDSLIILPTAHDSNGKIDSLLWSLNSPDSLQNSVKDSIILQFDSLEVGKYNLYICAIDDDTVSSDTISCLIDIRLYRPTVFISPNQRDLIVGESITFKANAFDTNSTINTFQWFHNGNYCTTTVADSFHFTFNTLGTEYIAVTVIDDDSLHSNNSIATISVDKKRPILISPQNDSLLDRKSALVKWNKFEKALKYDLLLINNTGLDTLVRKSISDTSCTLSLELKCNTTYSWNVLAVNQINQIDTSLTWSFTTPETSCVVIDDFNTRVYDDDPHYSYLGELMKYFFKRHLQWIGSWGLFYDKSTNSQVINHDGIPIIALDGDNKLNSYDSIMFNDTASVQLISNSFAGLECRLYDTLGDTADMFWNCANLEYIDVRMKGSGEIKFQLVTKDIYDSCPDSKDWNFHGTKINIPSEWTVIRIPVADLKPDEGSKPFIKGCTIQSGIKNVNSVQFAAYGNNKTVNLRISKIEFIGMSFEEFGFIFREIPIR